MGWAVGIHGEHSDDGRADQATTRLPLMLALRLADAQVARWQDKHMGETPGTDQQRSWLVSKMRLDIAMEGTKLNARSCQ